MENYQIFLEILLIHFLADFVLQTNEQAQGKSKGWNFINYPLINHVTTYSMVWFIWFVCHFSIWQAIGGTMLMWITHYITDWITSRMSKDRFNRGDYHNGFIIIGADQLIHYATIIGIISLF